MKHQHCIAIFQVLGIYLHHMYYSVNTSPYTLKNSSYKTFTTPSPASCWYPSDCLTFHHITLSIAKPAMHWKIYVLTPRLYATIPLLTCKEYHCIQLYDLIVWLIRKFLLQVGLAHPLLTSPGRHIMISQLVFYQDLSLQWSSDWTLIILTVLICYSKFYDSFCNHFHRASGLEWTLARLHWQPEMRHCT